ncbi:uncharacterized protein LOC119276380 isoform X1 [Triticum dicoccoides]|uniref:uncharacterized protein LOC119276380 isoform X1 n=1 Tax=Triticum dicoccoides TaxID=85692 RepID=UPI00188F546E|nr:uncharacterized protein LOC119276380 isoform X1 [Triticum dicoccoides]
MAVLFHSPFNFEYWSPRRAQLWLRMSARAQGCCSARRCGRFLPRGGLSRAYPGVSTVGTTCTASCWPLKASSWSTATPRLQIGGIEKRNGVPWIGHALERERQAAAARGLASFLLFLLLPYDFLVGCLGEETTSCSSQSSRSSSFNSHVSEICSPVQTVRQLFN